MRPAIMEMDWNCSEPNVIHGLRSDSELHREWRSEYTPWFNSCKQCFIKCMASLMWSPKCDYLPRARELWSMGYGWPFLPIRPRHSQQHVPSWCMEVNYERRIGEKQNIMIAPVSTGRDVGAFRNWITLAKRLTVTINACSIADIKRAHLQDFMHRLQCMMRAWMIVRWLEKHGVIKALHDCMYM